LLSGIWCSLVLGGVWALMARSSIWSFPPLGQRHPLAWQGTKPAGLPWLACAAASSASQNTSLLIPSLAGRDLFAFYCASCTALTRTAPVRWRPCSRRHLRISRGLRFAITATSLANGSHSSLAAAEGTCVARTARTKCPCGGRSLKHWSRATNGWYSFASTTSSNTCNRFR
jgi:hypothetical protein